jgi:hypothetical protein
MAKYVGKCVDFVVEGVEDEVITRRLKQSIPVTALNTVTQLCTLLDAMLQEEKGITDPQVKHSAEHRRQCLGSSVKSCSLILHCLTSFVRSNFEIGISKLIEPFECKLTPVNTRHAKKQSRMMFLKFVYLAI